MNYNFFYYFVKPYQNKNSFIATLIVIFTACKQAKISKYTTNNFHTFPLNIFIRSGNLRTVSFSKTKIWYIYNNLHLTNYLCLICFFGIKIFSSLLVTFRAGCLFRIKPNFFLLWFFKLIPYEHDIRYVDSFQPFWQSPSLLNLEWKCSSWSENLYWLCENVTKILNFAWRQKPSGQLFSFCPYSAHWSFFSMELMRILFNLFLCNTCIIYIVSSIILWWMDCI